jgi:hypothetical protein
LAIPSIAELEGKLMAANREEERDLPNPGRRSRRRWGKWFGCLVLISLLAGGLYFASLRHHWRAEFHQRIAAIRAAGFPVTGKELDAWYPWPQSGENAANWITGAATLWQRPDQEEAKALEALLGRRGDRPHPTEPLSPDLKALLERYIRANSRTLKSLHDAAAITECRYPVDFSAGPGGAWMLHIPNVRDGGRLLCLEAVLLAENRDAEGAAKATEAVLHIAQSLEKEPMMISHIVRLATANVGSVALERALNRIEFTAESLVKLQEAFRDVRVEEGLVRAIAENRCSLLGVFEKPQALNRESFDHLPSVPFLEAYAALGLSAREGVIFLDYMDECLRIAQLPMFERSAALGAIEARFRARKGIFLREARYTTELIRRATQEAVWIGMAVTTLAVERYRLAHAKPPETLGQLVPDYLAAVPEDPFDGAPLRYQRLGRGFAVYSVGQDGKDDSGAEEPPKEMKKEGQTYDLVFRVERPWAVTP